jgi:endonuclease/exonuclease/phosphatase family metal-dependent hydrolase
MPTLKSLQQDFRQPSQYNFRHAQYTMYYQLVPYYKYNSTTGAWEKIEWFEIAQQEEIETVETHHRSIKVATFNVLYDLIRVVEPAIRSQDRFNHQIQHILPQLDADIIALQEVTFPYLGKLLQQKWVIENYKYCTSYSERTENDPTYDQHAYTVVILSKLPIREAYIAGTGIGIHYTRSPVCVISYPGQDRDLTFTLCAVHLKALYQFADVRAEQLDDLFQMFGVVPRTHDYFVIPEHQRINRSTHKTRKNKRKKMITPKNKPEYVFRELHNVVIVGDYNLQQEREENFIPECVTDVWSTLRPGERGYTIDPERNTMIYKKVECRGGSGDEPQLRTDRICVLTRQEADVKWEAHTINMFADEPVPLDDTKDVYPSDHFGLMVEISLICTSSL